jgi:two-component system NarL family sensor kinase
VWRLTSRSVGGAVAQFALVGLAVLVVVGLGGSAVLRSQGRSEAIREAREVTRFAAEAVVEPAVTPSLLRGDPRAVASMDTVVGHRVLRPPVVRVKLWSPTGRILYSDEHRLIGQRYRLGVPERQALLTGRTDADISNLDEPENRYERGAGKLLEVYLGVRGPGGRSFLFETYQSYDAVASGGHRVWTKFVPVLLGALGLLALLQIPLAWRLAARVRRSERERLQLAERALDASLQERRRIAGDLHDGVVQSLAGISYGLAAASEHIDDEATPELRDGVRQAAHESRRSIRELRSLLVDIYPPSLEREGLHAALSDLMTRAGDDRLGTRLEIEPGLEAPANREALVFRAAQETLRNVVAHADARNVLVAVTQPEGAVRLVVQDDGRGFDPAAATDGVEDGHFGLRALRDLVGDAGGTMEVDTQPGRGTRVIVEVPVP